MSIQNILSQLNSIDYSEINDADKNALIKYFNKSIKKIYGEKIKDKILQYSNEESTDIRNIDNNFVINCNIQSDKNMENIKIKYNEINVKYEYINCVLEEYKHIFYVNHIKIYVGADIMAIGTKEILMSEIEKINNILSENNIKMGCSVIIKMLNIIINNTVIEKLIDFIYYVDINDEYDIDCDYKIIYDY